MKHKPNKQYKVTDVDLHGINPKILRELRRQMRAVIDRPYNGTKEEAMFRLYCGLFHKKYHTLYRPEWTIFSQKFCSRCNVWLDYEWTK